MDIANAAEGILRQVTNNEQFKDAYRTFYDSFMGFYHAIAWKDEPWLVYLLGFHVSLWSLVFITRRRLYLQAFLLVFISCLIYFCERINRYAGSRWSEFATQNYFDERGVFAGIMYAGPLIILLLFQLLNSLYQTSQMLVHVKREELKQKMKSKKE
mmetsp:Transcript_17844/g.28914  ORF Transcript_17844/g.28914 Transcript_17844/m.28914 type:complete len:156 (-) Transcript_17844:2323-2790(-)